ncbi:hypothetical protein RYX36_023765, partial [Vicia faba]
GRAVSFNRNLVSQYLGHPLTLQRGELCSYQKRVASKNGDWIYFLVHFKRRDMNTKTQLYATLFLYNINPRSHTSTIPIDTSFLLYYMIKGWKIDVAQVISNEIRKIAISGHSHGNKTAMTLGFLAPITGLCGKVGVYIPDVAIKRISSIMNEDYFLRHCVPKLTCEAAPQPQAHAPPTGPVRYNQQQACVYNWKMMEAQMRACFFLHDFMQMLYRHKISSVISLT